MAYEAQRQYQVWRETGRRLGQVPKETRGWDDAAQTTWGQRSKEESSDYRYFPDPDLVPVTISDAEIERARASLDELPARLRTRLETSYGISPYDSDVIVNQGRALVDYYVELADRCGDGKLASNWVQQDVLRTLNEKELTIGQYPVAAEALAELIRRCAAGQLETSRGREVLAAMIATGKTADEAMQALGIRQVDDSDLVALGQELLRSNPKILNDLKAGNMKAAGWLIGQAKKRNPNVNPNRFREICLDLVKKEGIGD